MTPQEISDYKLKWAPGIPVRVHSDQDWVCKNWCRTHLDRHQWTMSTFTNVYEHTFQFEHKHHAKQFAALFALTD